MNHILRTLGAATVLTIGLAFGLVSCAGNESALKGGKVALTAYETTQQAMIIYGSLDTCPKSKPICKSHETWQKLKAADAVATTAIMEATPVLNGTEADVGQIFKVYSAIQKVKEAFTEATDKLAASKLESALPSPEPAPATLKPTVTP